MRYRTPEGMGVSKELTGASDEMLNVAAKYVGAARELGEKQNLYKRVEDSERGKMGLITRQNPQRLAVRKRVKAARKKVEAAEQKLKALEGGINENWRPEWGTDTSIMLQDLQNMAKFPAQSKPKRRPVGKPVRREDVKTTPPGPPPSGF